MWPALCHGRKSHDIFFWLGSHTTIHLHNHHLILWKVVVLVMNWSVSNI
jgi:hypothetical protein